MNIQRQFVVLGAAGLLALAAACGSDGGDASDVGVEQAIDSVGNAAPAAGTAPGTAPNH